MPDPTDKDVLIEVMSPLVTGLYSSLDRALELAQQLPRGVDTLENLEFIPTEDLEQGFLPFEADEDEQEGEGDAGQE